MLPGIALSAVLFTARMEHRIDDLGTQLIQAKRSPGFALGVVENGRIVYTRGFGFADLAHHRRFDPSTQTYVGSISKQFTAAAILLLEQDGKLKLDDPVTRFVPELSIAKGVTIRELLNQTSGLPDESQAAIDQDRTKSIKLDRLVAAMDKLKLVATPGSQFRYNNFNYAIAGLIVERASGVPLSDYLQQHIFLPLLMNQTFCAGDTGISPQHAVGYTGAPGDFERTKPWDPAWLFGDGEIVTNLYDLAKWDIGMPLLLRVDAVRDMFTPTDVPGAFQYGMGWVIDERNGRPYMWHNGELAGYHAMNALLPEDHVAVIVLANTDDFRSHAVIAPEQVAAEVLDIVAPPARTHMDNTIVARAKEWLTRIADRKIDRTQLTPAFSAYLTDALVAHANFAALGRPLDVIPVASWSGNDGSTIYEFLVRFEHGTYHYRFGLTPDGKINELLLVP
ncbi:MAG TPA: serine hydrolase domain-containing protein [Candidatus Baltobacteraceae bacterium]|nr:serine hydrolase domain-containing protein [Candidatus Baltobacteraceae bacterium]